MKVPGIHSFGTWVTCIWRGISFGLYKHSQIFYMRNIKNVSLDATFHAEFNEHISEYFTLENQTEMCNSLKNSRYFDGVILFRPKFFLRTSDGEDCSELRFL